MLMNKPALVACLAEEMNLSKADASRALDKVADIVTNVIVQGGEVTLPGIGKFISRTRPAQTVRNPATGERVHKEATKVVKVRIAKTLRDRVAASGA